MKKILILLLILLCYTTPCFPQVNFEVIGDSLPYDITQLYLKVCQILDITPKDFNYRIIIDGSENRCIPEIRTIYLTKEDKFILVHELAHMCLFEEFIASRPNKTIHELLANWVEFKFRNTESASK